MVAIAKPTKAELAAQARRDYIENTRPVMIDMDGDRPYAVVPSQDGSRTYRVYFVEPRDAASYATECSCSDHKYRKTICKHHVSLEGYEALILALTEQKELEEKAHKEAEEALGDLDDHPFTCAVWRKCCSERIKPVPRS
jgi:hypothetical protein